LKKSAVGSYVTRNAAPKRSFTPVTVIRTLTAAPLVEPASIAIVFVPGEGVSGVKVAEVEPPPLPPSLPPPQDGSAVTASATRAATARRWDVRRIRIGIS
jgi:hypothetical protein